MVKAVEGGRIFFQLLELGYEKFPHNITAVRIRNCVQGFTNIHVQSTPDKGLLLGTVLFPIKHIHV